MIISNLPKGHIVKAEKGDIPVIISLAQATWEHTYRDILSKAQIDFMFNDMYSPKALNEQMTEMGHTFLLLYVEETPVGYASYSSKPEDEGVFRLQKLYLLPELQGKGLGRLLMNAVEAQVRREKGQVLELNVNRYNPARTFYERCGFTFYREEDIPIGEFWMNDFVMRKPIEL
jgi:diamine N-acetyltransferase